MIMDMEDTPLSKKGIKKIYHEYDSMNLLQAVDALDEIRGIVGDQEHYKPPQIRFDLMNLHTYIFNLIRQGQSLNRDEREKLYCIVENLESEMSTIIENATMISEEAQYILYELFADCDEKEDHATGLSDLSDNDWLEDDEDDENNYDNYENEDGYSGEDDK